MRVLPWNDETIDALPMSTRRTLARLWSERAISESRVGVAFGELERELTEVSAAPDIVALARRAARDERRHANLCRRLAERYDAGTPLGEARLAPRLPYARAPLRTRVVLRCASLACVSETIACAWIGGCAELASSPLARAVNRVHLGDEIGHARLGWALLASPVMGPRERAALVRELPRLLVDGVTAWLDAARVLPVRSVPSHGIPSRTRHRRWVYDATFELVLPGFAAVGLDTAPATRACTALLKAAAQVIRDV
jgi:hypothetical protein